MKRTAFLNELRQKLEGKSADTLKGLVIDIAKYVPRGAYEDVLLLLEKEKKVEPVVMLLSFRWAKF